MGMSYANRFHSIITSPLNKLHPTASQPSHRPLCDAIIRALKFHRNFQLIIHRLCRFNPKMNNERFRIDTSIRAPLPASVPLICK